MEPSVVALIVGLFSGAVGSYIGIKVGLTRLEVWQEIADRRLGKVEGHISVLNEDYLTHDFEIGRLMENQNIPRSKRQTRREF